MLTPIFSAYGRIDNLSLLVDPVSKRSKGAAVVSFRDHVDAKKAIEQLDGVEIAGKAVCLHVSLTYLDQNHRRLRCPNEGVGR